MPADAVEVGSEKSPSREVSEFGRLRIRRYLTIAVITRFLAIVGVLVAIFIRLDRIPMSDLQKILIVAAAEGAANLAYFALGFRRWPKGAFHFSGLVDAAAVGIIVSVTGGSSSEFAALFSLVIVFNGVFYGWPGLLSGTLGSILALVVASVGAPEQVDTAKLAVELGVFAGLGFLSGIVGEGERADRRELQNRARVNARQTRQLQTLFETSTTIGSNMEAEALLTTAAEGTQRMAAEMWGTDIVTSITLFDHGKDQIRIVRVSGPGGEASAALTFPASIVPPKFQERWSEQKPYMLSANELAEMRGVLGLPAPHGEGALVIPIVVGEEVLGFLTVRFVQAPSPSAAQVEVVVTVANHLASALSRVRTLENERHRREQATALFELARDLNALSDLNSFLAQISEASIALGGVDICAVALLDAEARSIDPTTGAVAGVEGTSGAILRDLAPMHIEEVDRALRDRVPVEIHTHKNSSDEARRAAMVIGAESCLVLPIVAQDRPIGFLCFAYKTAGRRFSIVQIQLAEAIAGLAAVGAENVRLHEAEKKMVHDLRELDRLKTEMVSTASHELRSPLTSISGYAATLLRSGSKFTEEERQEFLQVIDRQAKQLARLIDELLTISKIEEGKVALALRPTDLVRITHDLIAAAKMRTDRHVFETDFSPDFPQVVADEGKLNDILTNLIDNAMKYSPEGGRIRIGGKIIDHETRFWVSDEGAGIPEKDLAAIFDRFFQVDGRHEAGGSGLGLYIVSSLVKAHDGRIWVESEEGRGTTLFVALPQRRASDRLSIAPA